MHTRRAIVFPDDTSKPLLDAIDAAKKILRIKMFVFSDPQLVNSVIAVHARGVLVRVMLNPARRDGKEENEETRKSLIAAGIDVRDSNPEFALTHEKSMTIDDEISFINSLNWETKNLTLTRDYAIVTNYPHEVKEVIAGFEADWNREKFEPGPHASLIWCPGHGRDRIADFIDNTNHSLYLQNERYQDLVIIERLMRASKRGVKVHIMAKAPHSLKADKLIEGVEGLRIMDDAGIKIHSVKHLKLHGKILYGDNIRAIVGSINLTAGSFDDRRELAIELNDDEAIVRLHEIIKSDWENSRPMDLSDRGLLNDLKSRNEDATELLVLTPPRKKKGK
jgi:phosphatidylserine/phosphatidylglycerophosphate/cardiolipin synthase-like enzyme